MKKILCFILAAVLSCSAVSITATAQEDSTGFVVATDLHYVHPLENVEDYVEANTFNSNENGYAYQHESGFIIDEFLNQCAKNEDCDFILLPGDLVTYGRDYPEDHMALAEKFRSFEKSTGKQIYVINGNHDNGAGTFTDHTKFTEIYHEFGYDKAFSVDESCCSYAVNLNEEYALIALDSCDENYSLTNGITLERLNWVREQAKAITQSGRKPVMIMHHNLLEHSPLQLITNDKYIVAFPRTFATLFADWGIKLVFTGHTHLTDAVSHTSPAGNVIYDFCTSALSEYPFQYRTFEMTDDVITYGMQNIKKIDTDALSSVVSGYTQEQLTAMATDMPAYAAAKESARTLNTLKKSLSAEGLGFSNDDAVYETINSACESIDKLFSMSLYGENSVQQLAKEYNIEIPDSSYENIWSIGSEIYLNFVAGNKKFDFESLEAQIILNGAVLALRSTTAEIADEKLLSAANVLLGGDIKLAEEITKAGTDIFGAVTPLEYFALAIAAPFVNAYGSDTDSVENFCGEIPGYNADISNFEYILNSISDTFLRIAEYIALVFNTAFKWIF